MIAKSDFIILALSTTFLVAGIIRWQHNTSVVPVVTIPASSQGVGVNVAARQEQELAPTVTRLPARAEEQAGTRGAIGALESEARTATMTTSDSSSPVTDPSPELLGTYTVVPGDYLGWIAEEFGTTVAALKELNGLDGNDIRIGQKIKYPLPN